MKTILIPIITTAMLIAACGGQAEEATADASPLDVMPDASLFSIAIVDPAAVVSAMDSYAAGVPLLGESAISGWVLSALDCADMSEVDSKLGIRTEGGLSVYMESMMPQSIGAALTVSDIDTFWANTGITPAEAEPLEGYSVSSIPVDFGSIYFCHTNGLLLAAGSRAGLQSMLARIDGQMPQGLPEIPEGSIYMYTNVEIFGPMVATQLEMLKPQLMAEMNAEGELDMDMMQGVMGLYFDAIGLVLNDTRSWYSVLTFGPEYITGTSSVEYIPGSTLDQYLVPVEPEDMTGLVPAGDVMIARVSIDPETSRAAINAVFQAMGITDIPQEMVDFWAESARNTAMSMVYDPNTPMHLVGVYDTPEGTTLEDVKNAYDMQFQMMGDFLSMPGLELVPVEYSQYMDREWISFGMTMDMTEMIPDTAQMEEAPVSPEISWTAWMTLHEGVLYMEMAPEPATVASMLDGSYQGPYASDMPEMAGVPASSEIVFLLNLPGYLNTAMGLSGLAVPPVDSEPVWMEMEVDLAQGGMSSSFSVSGTDLTAFVGKAIQTFGAMAE